MKKLLVMGACIFALVSGPALAGKGSPKTDEERAQRMERMKQHLQLTDEQVAQIKQIRAEGGKREDIREVLTEEQRATWDAHRAQHKQHHGKQNEEKQDDEAAPSS